MDQKREQRNWALMGWNCALVLRTGRYTEEKREELVRIVTCMGTIIETMGKVMNDKCPPGDVMEGIMERILEEQIAHAWERYEEIFPPSQARVAPPGQKSP